MSIEIKDGELVKIKINKGNGEAEEYTAKFICNDENNIELREVKDEEPSFTMEYKPMPETFFKKAEESIANGDKPKGIRYYIDSLKDNSNPDQIITIIKRLLENREYESDDELYYLLTKKWMLRDEDFEELKCEIESSLGKKIKKMDYYSLASKAKEDGNLPMAIDCYKNVLMEGCKDTRNENYIPSLEALLNIYIAQKKFDESLKLIEKYSSPISDSKINEFKFNIYINRLKENKTDKYSLDELKEIGKKIIHYNYTTIITPDKKIYLLLELLQILEELQQYDEIIYYLDEQIEYEGKKRKLSEKISDELKNEKLSDDVKNKFLEFLSELMKSYYVNHKKSQAKTIAQILLDIDSQNEDAKNVINNSLKVIESSKIKFDDIFVNKFFQDKINNIDSKIVRGFENINYNNPIDIVRLISNIRDYSCYWYENYFVGARLIRDKKDKKQDGFYYYNYILFLVNGACTYADYRISYKIDSENKNIEVAKYCYLYAMRTYRYNKLIDDNDVDKIPLFVATKLYLQSLFDDQKKLRAIKIESIYNEFRNKCLQDYEEVIIDVFTEFINEFESVSSKCLFDNDKDSFLNFMIGIIEFLKCNPVDDSKIFELIWESPLKNSKLLDHLSEILESHISKNIEKNIYCDYWTNAKKKYFKLKEELFNSKYNLIDKAIDSLFDLGNFEERVNSCKQSKFVKYFNKIDSEYFKCLCDIFEYILDYNKCKDNDIYSRQSNLEEAYKLTNSLINKATEEEYYPTYFYCDFLLARLETIKKRVIKESERFDDLKPDLNIEVKYLSFVKNNIKLNVILENNSQKDFKNLKISSITSGSKFVEHNGSTEFNKIVLKSGHKNSDIKIVFEVIDDNISSELPISLEFEYEYKKNILEDKYEHKTLQFEKIIHLNNVKNFKTIDNGFKYYETAKVIEDNSKFYGRDDDLRYICSNIYDDQNRVILGQSLCLYGQQRTGKSSILYHLQKDYLSKNKNIIIVDLGNVDNYNGDIPLSIKAILLQILLKLEKELKRNHRELNKELKENDLFIDSNEFINTSDELLEVNFENQFKPICDFVHDKNMQIIVLIDEFTSICDLIVQGKITDRFMAFWKAFIQDYKVFAIVIGQDHFESFSDGDDIRFTNGLSTTKSIPITYLSEEYAKKLMYEPILDEQGKSRYTDEALDYLYELTAGSAYLITKLCFELVNYLNKIKNPNITRAVIDEYLNDNIDTFKALYFNPQCEDKEPHTMDERKKRFEDNKGIIRTIARESDDSGWIKKEKLVLFEKEELFEKLVKRDVLIKKDDKYKIKVDLYRKWILAKEGRG